MGRYIAHKRRKIKWMQEDAWTDGAAAPAVRGLEGALRREAKNSNWKEPAPSNRRAR